jgi:MFS family permease
MRVVTVSLTVAAVCTLSYGVLPSLWMLLGVSIVHAIADSFTMPGNQVSAALAGPPEQASSAQGLLGATGLAAAGLTGLVAGALYEEWGRLAVTATTAAVMVVFIGTARWLVARPPREAAAAAQAGTSAGASDAGSGAGGGAGGNGSRERISKSAPPIT